MKKIYLPTLIFLLFNTTFAEVGWQIQNTGVTNTLYGVDFINANTGIAVGVQGKIIRTNNGGISWITTSPAPTGFYFSAVQMITSSIIFTVGSIGGSGLGTIYKSTDGGFSWGDFSIYGCNQNLRGVSFLDVNNGFVCGVLGSVWRTTNGGVSWTNQPGVTYTMNVIQMLDINNIICCGDGGNIYKTTNGGINWYPRISNANGVNLNGMSFMDANRGIVVGNLGTVLVTTNGGETWTRTLYQGSGIFRAVSFVSMLRATFVADGGYIYSSADGGNNWLLQQSNIYLSLLAVKFLDNNIGKVVGEQGTCLITNTGGWNTGIKNINSNIPDKYSLNQNYPNPFNPGTKIQFNIKEKGISRIDIYNTSGKLMETLFNTELQPGSYESIWDASNYSSGVYYYRLISKNYSETRKMILVK